MTKIIANGEAGITSEVWGSMRQAYKRLAGTKQRYL